MDQGAIASLIMSIVAILLAVLYFVLRQRIYQRALSDKKVAHCAIAAQRKKRKYRTSNLCHGFLGILLYKI